ncbi:MAG TPA: hypothetical protein VEI03_22225 [Stellaceae bacterium]|nr:hypothetical protein [Stellaceae bacterium]
MILPKRRALLALLAFLLLAPSASLRAQAPPAAAAPVSADELQRLVDTLQDDKQRAQLIGDQQR